MAKRKKQQSADIPRKRAKAAEQRDASSQEYRIKTILKETVTHYYIDWEDSENGEKFAPTWEPKANANEQAIADWNAQQVAKITVSATPVKRRGRPRKVIDSSPSPGSVLKNSQTGAVQPFVIDSSAPATPDSVPPGNATVSDTEQEPLGTVEGPLEASVVGSQVEGGIDKQIVDSQAEQAVESPLFEPEDVLAAVTVNPPPSSFDAGGYQTFPSSQRPSEVTASAFDQPPEDRATAQVRAIDDTSLTLGTVAEIGAAVAQVDTPLQDDLNTVGGADVSDHEARSLSHLAVDDHTSFIESPVDPSQPEAVEAAATSTETEVPDRILEAEAGATATSGVIPDSQSLQNSSTVLTDAQGAALPSSGHKAPPGASASFNTFESSFPFLTQISVAPRASSLPAPSPLISVPTHSLIELEQSDLSRPRTPSPPVSASMPLAASQQTPSSSGSLAAKIKALREKHKPVPSGTEPAIIASPIARLLAEEDHRRSPSVVPAIEPEEPVSQEEMNTSERYQTLIPRDQEQTNGSSQMTSAVRPASFNRTSGLTRSFVVPIALVGHQRDQYPATVYFHKDFIQRFLAADPPNPELTAQAERFVERMRHVALHPDLDNVETFTQYSVEPQAQAQWDVDCSAKFRFLKDLFSELRHQTLQVVIIANGGQIVHILETFLTGLKVPHRRYGSKDDAVVGDDHAGLMVTLAAPDGDHQARISADLVISMSPNASDRVSSVKSLGPGCTELTLVVPYTVEHVDVSLATMLSSEARLRALVSGIYTLRNDAGKLDEDQSSLTVAALQIAKYLQHLSEDEEADFPVSGLTTLHNLDSQTESDASGIGQKRSLDDDDSMESSKRLRTTTEHEPSTELPTTINPQEIEITHISDSIDKSTNSQPSVSTKQRLQKLLEEAHKQKDEYILALSDLQYRHEDQRAQLFKVTDERDQAIQAIERSLSRYSEAANSASKLKARCTELEEQLVSAQARLVQHEVPERAELEAAKLDAEKAKVDHVKTQKQLEKVQADLDYTRSLYQSASQSTSGLAEQNTDLERRLAASQSQVASEHSKLRQMGYDAHTKNLEKENKRLKALLLDREAGMKFRDEEIARMKEASRGRMGTRGTSIPRTPRLGSPMKSRQGSPAAGELRGGKGAHGHPLRNG